MRRTSRERQDARRELALAVTDLRPRDSAEVREKAQRRIVKAARAVLAYVLTEADRHWLDRWRPKRQKADATWRQLDLLEAEPPRRSAAATFDPLPPCVNPMCGTTGGMKRYDGLCAACADKSEREGRARRGKPQ